MKKNNASLYLVAIFAVAILIGVGYAALATTLNINGTTTINKSTWDVHFEQIKVSSGEGASTMSFTGVSTNGTSATDLTTDFEGTTLNYNTTLAKPGSYAEFTVAVKNGGTIDAKLSMVSLPHSLYNAITATCVWADDDSTITTGTVLAGGESRTIRCRNEYKTDLSSGDLNSLAAGGGTTSTTSFTATYNLVLQYVQAEQ